MAFDAEVRHLFLEQFCDRRTMGIVAGGAGTILDRCMNNPGFFQGFAEISMTFQAQVPDGAFEEVLFRCLMGGVAFGAGPNGNGTVHELLLERGAVMTSQTESCLVFTVM